MAERLLSPKKLPLVSRGALAESESKNVSSFPYTESEGSQQQAYSPSIKGKLRSNLVLTKFPPKHDEIIEESNSKKEKLKSCELALKIEELKNEDESIRVSQENIRGEKKRTTGEEVRMNSVEFADETDSSIVTDEDSEKNSVYMLLSEKVKELKPLKYFENKKSF